LESTANKKKRPETTVIRIPAVEKNYTSSLILGGFHYIAIGTTNKLSSSDNSSPSQAFRRLTVCMY